MNKSAPQDKKGFTLIELLVVVLIIGILAAIALPQYELSVEKTRMAEAVSNVKVLMSAADRYFLANGHAPAKLKDMDISLQETETEANTITTKYFDYAIFTDANGVYRVRAYRPPDRYFIVITSDLPGRIQCWPSNPTPIQQRLCNQTQTERGL